MVHLYALADHPARLPAVRGIGATALTATAVDAIDAVFSDVVGPRDPDETTIFAHAHVVEELAKINDAVLPARLAQPLENESALVEEVRTRAEQFRGALERVRGCLEMGVRVLQPKIHARATSGRDYMRLRLDAVNAAGAVAAELDAAVAETVRESIRGTAGTHELVVTVAYLVPRDETERFRAAVEEIATGRPDLEYVCVGPWPPYSFSLVDGGS